MESSPERHRRSSIGIARIGQLAQRHGTPGAHQSRRIATDTEQRWAGALVQSVDRRALCDPIAAAHDFKSRAADPPSHSQVADVDHAGAVLGPEPQGRSSGRRSRSRTS